MISDHTVPGAGVLFTQVSVSSSHPWELAILEIGVRVLNGVSVNLLTTTRLNTTVERPGVPSISYSSSPAGQLL